jgi:hypothetical protein
MMQHLFVWLIVAMTVALAGVDTRPPNPPGTTAVYEELGLRRP